MDNRLTICIPTYGRKNSVLQALEKLLPQMTGDCSLVVLDNHSPEDPSEAVLEKFRSFPNARCKLIRHLVNVGANGNILRCFEMADSGWLWICGDDDHSLPDAISTIFRATDEFHDTLYINFASLLLEIGDKTVRHSSQRLNRAAFFSQIDCFSNLLYVSTGVYHVQKAQQCLRMGYGYAHTHAMHVAMILHGLETGHSVALHSSRIVQWARDEKTAWDHRILLFTYGILECIPRAQDRAAFRRVMAVGNYVRTERISWKMRLVGLALTEEPIAFHLHQYLLLWPGLDLLYGSTAGEAAKSCAQIVWEACFVILALAIRRPFLRLLTWWKPEALAVYKQAFTQYDLHQLRSSNRV